MSRLFGYLGPNSTLERLLFSAPNAIANQARSGGDLLPGDLCTSGFSLGWYASDGSPCRFSSPMPIWLEPNLPDLARGLESDIWLGVAFPDEGGVDPGEQACAARDDEFLYLFHGQIPKFGYTIRSRLRDFLSVECEAGIIGGGPQEHLLALLHHLLASDEDLSIEEAIAQSYELCRNWLGEDRADLSFLLSDGERLFAARLAVNQEPSVSYYTTDDEHFSGAQVLASEPLTDSDFWHPLAENCMLILDPEQPAELLDLEPALD